LKSFTIDGDAQTDGQDRNCIRLSGLNGDVNYLVLENIEIKNSGKTALEIFEVSYSIFKNFYIHDGAYYGVHIGTNTPGKNMYNFYQDFYIWNNASTGLDDRGAGSSYPREKSYTTYDNMHLWNNASYGFAIGGQKGVILSNSSVVGSATKGIYIYESDDINVHDCFITLNGHTILTEISTNISFTNVVAKNNSITAAASGFIFDECSDIKMNNCKSYDSRIAKGTDIAFVDGGAGADTITQVSAGFLKAGFKAGQVITVSGSTSNNGDETIVSVVAGTITLATGRNTPESAGATVTITGAMVHTYGVEVKNTCTAPFSIVDCKLSPNATGIISNTGAIGIIGVTGVVNDHAAVAGDIMYHNGTNWVRLAKGTANQYLKMNSGATAPIWVT